MTKAYAKLVEPIVINGTMVKNRVVVPPMADFGLTGSDGLVTERHLLHYKAFATGGAGLIIIEACAVSEVNESRNTINLFADTCIPGMRALAEAAKSNEAVALVQLFNSGLSGMPEREIAHISREKFLQYKADFVSAAIRCREAGFDGIELHAAHGFYLNEIIETSTRTDEYGGSFENRVRIISELIGEVKAACRNDFIVAVRFGNPSIPELLKTAVAIEAAGGDILDISTGLSEYQDVPADFPFDSKIFAASQVKAVAGIPVIGVGDIVSGEQAEQILCDGLADMAAIGRGHLCDPAWTNKILSGKKPAPCRKCRTCLWFIDGRNCPVAKSR